MWSCNIKKVCPSGRMMAVLAPANVHQQNEWVKEHTYLIAENYDTHFVIA